MSVAIGDIVYRFYGSHLYKLQIENILPEKKYFVQVRPENPQPGDPITWYESAEQLHASPLNALNEAWDATYEELQSLHGRLDTLENLFNVYRFHGCNKL